MARAAQRLLLHYQALPVAGKAQKSIRLRRSFGREIFWFELLLPVKGPLTPEVDTGLLIEVVPTEVKETVLGGDILRLIGMQNEACSDSKQRETNKQNEK